MYRKMKKYLKKFPMVAGDSQFAEFSSSQA